MSDFKVGDKVVFKDFYLSALLEIDAIFDQNDVGYKGFGRVFKGIEGFCDKGELRPATPAEIKACHRLEEVKK